MQRTATWDDILPGAILRYGVRFQVQITVTEVDQVASKFKGTSDKHQGGWEGQRKHVDAGDYMLEVPATGPEERF